jgi:hypothetical protein
MMLLGGLGKFADLAVMKQTPHNADNSFLNPRPGNKHRPTAY